MKPVQRMDLPAEQPQHLLPPAPTRLELPPAPAHHRWFWAIALVAVLAAIAIGWRIYSQRATPAATASKNAQVPVVADVAHKGDIGVYFTGLGTVTPLHTVTVKTRVDGQLMAVYYKEGQRVQKGAPLVEIDPRPYQVQLAQAQGQLIKDQAALSNAQIDLQRYQTLITHNAVAQQVLQAQVATVTADEGA